MPVDTLFSADQKKKLFSNHYRSLCMNIFEPNFLPVACLKANKVDYTLLVTQLVPDDQDTAFVLFGKGEESLRLQVVHLSEVEEEVARKGDALTQDNTFVPTYPLVVYAKVADSIGRIITSDQDQEVSKLFKKFSNEPKYIDEFKNLRKFRFDYIW